MNNASTRRSAFTLSQMLAAVAAITVLVFVLMHLPLQRGAREAARRNTCVNQLKQIALALHNYHDVYRAFPPAYTVDADSKPLHSWRTLILPFMEEVGLYKKLDLSKPWDDPVNAEAFKQPVGGFSCPSASCPESHTTYLAVISPDSCLQPGKSRKISEVTDGSDKTWMIVEVPEDHSVAWMSPQDASEELVLNMAEKFSHAGPVFNAALVDGSVRAMSADTSADLRRAMTTVAGHERVFPPE